MMNFEVRALPPAQFDQFLRLRGQVDPQTGQGYTTPGALAALNCGELCNPQALTTPPFDQSPTSQIAVK